MSLYRKIFGARGESIAERFLEGEGYRVVERNYRSPHGEVDLIALEGDVLAFVEVKTRKDDSFGTPGESVGRVKQARLVKTSLHYMTEKGIDDTDVRFDVVSITTGPDGALKPELIRDAFTPEEP